MSRHYPPATEGEMDRLLLVALPTSDAPICTESVARPLTEDEDDDLTSPRRAETLERLGVTVVRRRGRG